MAAMWDLYSMPKITGKFRKGRRRKRTLGDRIFEPVVKMVREIRWAATVPLVTFA